MGSKIMEKVYELYPQVKGRVDHAEFQTPLSHVDHLGKHEGGIYGLRPDMARFDDPEFISSIRWKTDIPGLYLSGRGMRSFLPPADALFCFPRVLA